MATGTPKPAYIGNSFTITELSTASPNNAAPNGSQFVWTDAGRSKPKEAWKVPFRMRTVRTDYSDKPTEQVLGPKFEDFTLSGMWDNKYNGGEAADFAENQRVSFYNMWKRGNLCRFDYEGISIVGLITNFSYEYKLRHRIAYSFTVSPHYYNSESKPRTAPKAAISPDNTDQIIADLLAKARAQHEQGPAAYIIKGTITNLVGANNQFQVAGQSLYDQVSKYINLAENSSRTIQAIVSNRTINAPLLTSQSRGFNNSTTTAKDQQNNTNNQTSIQRLIQELSNVKAVAKNMNGFLAERTSANDIIYQDASVILSYQDWLRNLRLINRQIISQCQQAIDSYSKLLQSDIIAIYRPQINESLYAISYKFYGTPTNWNVIYVQNNLHVLNLDGTELLKIPKVNP